MNRFEKKLLKINNNLSVYKYFLYENKYTNFENLDLTSLNKKISILHISDTHFSNIDYEDEKLVNINLYLKNKEFDFFVHTGDIINETINSFSNLEKTFLKNIPSKFKLFVNGNHDYSKKDSAIKVKEIMTNLGFIDLNNNYKFFKDEKILFVGLDPYNEYNFKEFCLKLNDDFFLKYFRKGIKKVLLIHDLDKVPKDLINYFDVILSGHTHAGEMNFILFNGSTFIKYRKNSDYKNRYKQYKGIKLIDGKTISIINPSLYSHTYYTKLRFLNRFLTEKEGICEIYLIN
jgi:predicted MPP superfamily phosphohydrolase